ncbi:lysine N(6)-hydroxylase/L-ornithine N(5)-oxygenase family protein [Millisia brevis]|uniref:lysine N(6)-hydroxylase/L-ornithine N(5)-oxygenase family protein n=1 Tax=Millisia brevis TaxID=264148 RepID=UPI0009FE9634|nr:SidA/IucD/PvdA family monooxygenase [Millisia brevis]
MLTADATEASRSGARTSESVCDQAVNILGIGFGPANLSLAIAIEEWNAALAPAERVRARFVEQQSRFGWHDGMLLPGATMQVSFLKDLVSLRAPTSSFTFLNYLHERGRLIDFVNLKTFFPMRREFHDYLSWAAARIGLPVDYGVTATRIGCEDGKFVADMSDPHGAMTRIVADSVVLGTGIRPVLPEGVVAGRRVFHNHRLLGNLDQLPADSRNRFLVVGAGQSAAEVAAYLHETYPNAEVHGSIRRYGYIPSDNTPYANRIFDPQAVDEYYAAPTDIKKRLLLFHSSTNYSAVDADLIEELYRREYEESLSGSRRLFVHRMTEVADVREESDGVAVVLRSLGDGGTTSLTVDAVVFSTGFRAADPRDLLGMDFDLTGAYEDDNPIVARDYSLRLPGLEGRFFLNGGVEHSHGLSSSLLSNLSVRASEILSAAVRSTPSSG